MFAARSDTFKFSIFRFVLTMGLAWGTVANSYVFVTIIVDSSVNVFAIFFFFLFCYLLFLNVCFLMCFDECFLYNGSL